MILICKKSIKGEQSRQNSEIIHHKGAARRRYTAFTDDTLIMNQNFFKRNIEYLKSFVGLTIDSAIQEEYYFDKELYKESMGTLLLTFDNGKSYTFDCDGDAESLLITCGNLTDKKQFETESLKYKWIKKEFISFDKLKQLKKIKKVSVELSKMNYGIIQTGCKLDFDNDEFLYIWIAGSDNIFYKLDMTPNYEMKTFKVELKEL
jgi:hypothetical protein